MRYGAMTTTRTRPQQKICTPRSPGVQPGPLPSVYRVSNDRKAIGAHKRSHEIRVVWGVRRARRSGFEAFGGS